MSEGVSDEVIEDILNSIGKKNMFKRFTNKQILDFLKERGLQQFLITIPSKQLRDAAAIKEEMEDDIARTSSLMRYNVLDFKMEQLIDHCWRHRLIDYFHYKNKEVFNFHNHHELGMRLVTKLPFQYYVGQKSHHHNRAKQIQRQYGISSQQKQQQQQHLDQENNNYQDQQQGDDSFIVEDEEQLQYEESQPQQQLSSSYQNNSLSNQKKMKSITKKRKNKNKKRKMVGKKLNRSASVQYGRFSSRNTQSENNQQKKKQELFEQENQKNEEKQLQKTQSKQKRDSKKKKLTLDSDQQ